MSRSKITSHTLVKNGADYIERALSSVKDFVEKMIVYDTGSTDGTQEIIRKLIKKGWKIKFREFGPLKFIMQRPWKRCTSSLRMSLTR